MNNQLLFRAFFVPSSRCLLKSLLLVILIIIINIDSGLVLANNTLATPSTILSINNQDIDSDKDTDTNKYYSSINPNNLDLIQPFINDPVKQALYIKLGDGLRCPTCTGLSILQSDAPFSDQIKTKLIEMINQGNDHQQIVDFFTDRYGMWILRQPPKSGKHLLMWILSGLLLLLCPVYLIFTSIKNSRSSLVKKNSINNNNIKEMIISYEELEPHLAKVFLDAKLNYSYNNDQKHKIINIVKDFNAKISS